MGHPNCRTGGTTLKIPTFNIEGAKANHAIIGAALKTHDILCIQEHWLHKYEQSTKVNLFPEWNYDGRSHDEYVQEATIEHTHRPGTGRGGVATLGNKDLDHMVSKSTVGNERIIVTVFNMKPKSTATSHQGLTVVIAEYRDKVVIAGDLNADIYNRTAAKEKLLSYFICKPIPRHKSQIDYILVSQKKGAYDWGNATKVDCDNTEATNTSKYYPISACVAT